MRVYSPGDSEEAATCLTDAYTNDGPAYIRLARNKEQTFHDKNIPIDINKILQIHEAGKDVNILTAGTVLSEGVKLCEMLCAGGISAGVFSVPRLKPFDSDGIINLALSSSLLVTLEDHQVTGGLGGMVAEIISGIMRPHAVLYRAGFPDCFTDQTGDQEYIRDFYGISAEKLMPRVKSALQEVFKG